MVTKYICTVISQTKNVAPSVGNVHAPIYDGDAAATDEQQCHSRYDMMAIQQPQTNNCHHEMARYATIMRHDNAALHRRVL